MKTIELKQSGFFHWVYTIWYLQLPNDIYTYIRRLIFPILCLPLYIIPVFLSRLFIKIMCVVDTSFEIPKPNGPYVLLLNLCGMLMPMVLFALIVSPYIQDQYIIIGMLCSWFFAMIGIAAICITFYLVIGICISIYMLGKEIVKLYRICTKPRGNKIIWK